MTPGNTHYKYTKKYFQLLDTIIILDYLYLIYKQVFIKSLELSDLEGYHEN